MKKRSFKPRQLDQNAIPTTSLADMMFLLLIFFIMTTTLARTTGFVTDAPAGTKSQEQQKQQDKTPTIALHDDKITLDGERDVDMSGLREYVKGLRLDLKAGEGKVVVLEANGSVKYQTYYETMALIQNSGGVVAIIREETEEKK